MSWSSFHRRRDVLRAVVAAADARRDGTLPMDVEGVPETFADELALLGALSLRWHTRLAGHLERELMARPSDQVEAVLAGWRATAAELPGVRSILDRHLAAPLDEAMAAALATAARKEHVLLAVMAGRTGAQDPAAPYEGELLESRARADMDADRDADRAGATSPEPGPGGPGPRSHAAAAPSLLERLRAALAA